ncbi:MAG: polysaccharide export protein [Desulfobacterales bacterium]|jgi:polysaccharide export outer membrane protein|nr:polysaccharide export protein [Desulfobacterales bacterium]
MNLIRETTENARLIIFRKYACKFQLTISLIGRILFFLTAGIFFLNNLPAEAQGPETGEVMGVYKFDVGDVLDVIVYEDPDMSRTVTVRSDGRISLPLVGEIMASGSTPEVLTKTITEKLTKYADDPKVTVILAQGRERVFYILGQIEEPGQYAITQPVTVLQAIARAGGFLEWAKKSRIMIVSAPGEPQKITYFNYENFLGGDDAGNVLINPGETIVVP